MNVWFIAEGGRIVFVNWVFILIVFWQVGSVFLALESLKAVNKPVTLGAAFVNYVVMSFAAGFGIILALQEEFLVAVAIVLIASYIVMRVSNRWEEKRNG